MPSRFEYERAIRASELKPPSRHLALTIATWADARTGIIPDRYQPSLTTLERATGLSRATVRTHLDSLEKGGWVKRSRPPVAKARAEGETTKYRILVPRTAVVPDEDPAEGRAGAALPEPEVGQELPQARAGDALPVGQELPLGRAGAALSSSSSSKSSVEYQQAGAADYGIPAEARPLVDALSLANVNVRWPFTGNEWFPLLALIKKSGVQAMTDHAAKVAARIDVESARYFLAGWAELPPLPTADAPRPPLRAVAGGWQPYTNPTDPSVYERGFGHD
ncbi:hypothetical protein [Streptomyces sp. NPDC048338]|uniref:hypothetical protein n=1 Tax=Streptomyces sp. NPDC048338 TaxID=3365536 RepID=UPI003713403B